ncbi:hypothetical protein ABIC65_001034 [Sphingomonas trueperi]|uniref:hypothetical protein n=1 Tax=Sphingomonas trueperi TaxID=53317 RepID=UPI003395735A
MGKRYRTLTAKPGEVKVAFGRTDRWADPSIVYAWGNGTDMRSASRLLMSALEDKPLKPTFGGGVEQEPSLVEELEARGFDITTLRFSIQKKQVQQDTPNEE